MQRSWLLEKLEENPIIAAVKDEEGLEACLECNAWVVFVLYGTVVDIVSIAKRISDSGKSAIVHIDLIDGLAAREAAVDYIAAATDAVGIISTRQSLTKRAREKGLLAVRRFFLLDSIAMKNLHSQLTQGDMDMIEVLPGVMPKTLRRVAAQTRVPLIAGGLIADKEDVLNALSAGAVAVSSTNREVWQL